MRLLWRQNCSHSASMNTSFFIRLAFFATVTASATAAPGDVDASFGTSGAFIRDVSTGQDVANAVAVQSDGKVLLAGHASPNNFTLLRLQANGTEDTGFGTAGRFQHKFGTFESAIGVAVQSTGRIVLGGAGLVGGVSRDFAVVRCLENGTLDTSFGSNGVTTTDIAGAYNEQVYAMARHTDDTIVLGGDHRNDFAMVRYLPNGALDTGFGTGGKVFTPGGSNTARQINALAIMSDGRIVVAGKTRNGNDDDVAVARYLSDGTPDGSFGTGGRTYTALEPGDTNDVANCVALQADGKVLAGGTSDTEFLLLRYTLGGILDTTFGTDGIVLLAFGGATQKGTGLAVQSDGKIILTGTVQFGGRDYFAAVRFLADGSLDTTFFDADKDDLVNLLEYAFGQNPTLPSSRTVPQGQVVGGNFVSTFTAPSTVTGITYAAEWSTSMTAASWQPVSNSGTGNVHTFSVPMSGRAKLFLRWKITAP
jgi:uncharacterized delta-60 repeat protein